MVIVDLYDNARNIIIDSGDTLKTFSIDSEYIFKMPITRENTEYWELSNIDF